MNANSPKQRDHGACRPRRLTALAAAGLLCTAQLSCALAQPAAAPARPQATAMSYASFTSNALLIQEVSRRLIAMLPPDGRLAVWVQLGPGAVAARAKADLVAELQPQKRIVWSVYRSQPGGPVADTTRPGQHVNVVEEGLDPPPQVVLFIRENAGRLGMSARPPGDDPLGPPTAGWTWVLTGP